MSDAPIPAEDRYSEGWILGDALERAAGLERRPKVGDPDHPLNVEKIREALGCIPNLCRVSVDYDYLLNGYVISHRVPPHEVTYRAHPQSTREDRTLDRLVVDQWYGIERRIDARYIERYDGDVGKLVRYLTDDIRYHLNKAMPRHA